MSVNINNFASFIFLENTQNFNVHLELGGVKHNKDLFFFLLDLFCKGLVLTYGGPLKKVEINSLSEADLDIVKEKMALAGIKASVIIIPESNDNVKSNAVDLEALDDNLNLENYIFKLQTLTCQYMIFFKITNIY